MAGLVGVPLVPISLTEKIFFSQDSVYYSMPCLKRGYRNKKSAEKEREFFNKEYKLGLTASYYCEYCNSWHHTSMPKKKMRKKKRANKFKGPHESSELLALREAVRRNM